MRTIPGQRPRVPSQTIVSGLRQIMGGIFGTPAHTPKQELIEQLAAQRGFYNFHQGDLFLPGPPAYSMDPSHETPLLTLWGHAFLVRANAFQPLAVGQVAYSMPVQPVHGLGGQQSGQMIMQPLTVRQAGG